MKAGHERRLSAPVVTCSGVVLSDALDAVSEARKGVDVVQWEGHHRKAPI